MYLVIKKVIMIIFMIIIPIDVFCSEEGTPLHICSSEDINRLKAFKDQINNLNLDVVYSEEDTPLYIYSPEDINRLKAFKDQINNLNQMEIFVLRTVEDKTNKIGNTIDLIYALDILQKQYSIFKSSTSNNNSPYPHKEFSNYLQDLYTTNDADIVSCFNKLPNYCGITGIKIYSNEKSDELSEDFLKTLQQFAKSNIIKSLDRIEHDIDRTKKNIDLIKKLLNDCNENKSALKNLQKFVLFFTIINFLFATPGMYLIYKQKKLTKPGIE